MVFAHCVCVAHFTHHLFFPLCFPLGSWGCGSCFLIKSASIHLISLPACQPPAPPIIPHQRLLSAIVVFHHLLQTRPAWLFGFVLYVCVCIFLITMAYVFVAIVYFDVILFVHAWCCSGREEWKSEWVCCVCVCCVCACLFVCTHIKNSSGIHGLLLFAPFL